MSPTPCAPGSVCIGGTCGVDGAAPPGPDTGCVEFDMPCTVDAECCSGACFDGYCDGDPGAATPPPDDACGAATDCLACTMLAACGFCDGSCVTSDTGAPPAGCIAWSWLPYECGF